ncbi:WD40-repeat-containing domain protein [Suillus lakei]|nr:WD40-repeat-containing domain protein [Suillus lakei]
MPRFLVGDELGNIKSVQYDPALQEESKPILQTLYDGNITGRTKGIQKLALNAGEKTLLSAAHANGAVSIFSLSEDDQLELIQEWKETRIKTDQSFIGLAASGSSVFSCTTNGALLMSTLKDDNSGVTHKLAALPSRLCDWRISHDHQTFAYGGDEVEVSLWDTERAFTPSVESSAKDTPANGSKKRKQGDTLFPGEIWRAKNVPNDFLGLRQPVHNTCLTYLSPSTSTSQQHLLAGTRLGDMRRYDTRAGRRPVAVFKGIGKVGGVKTVEKGSSEHEAFVSDHGSNVYAVDLRNGNIAYGYKGLSGTAISLAASPTHLASASIDRYIRIHSVVQLPDKVGQRLDKKGTVVERVFMTTVPTVVVWDQVQDVVPVNEDEQEGEDIWEGMKNVVEGDEKA